ncbi:MAG: dTMP kinase [Acidobacteriota bacterium]|nr:MAG: dTMP kinase [Acidobacteriota bacterium]
MQGKFITFEGIEGSGKSLQLQLLTEELTRRGVPYAVTLEPGGTAFGQELRQVLLRTDGAPREPIAELLLYLADRYQHLQEVVEPRLKQGITVISDRYHDATLAYQGYARGIGIERIEEIGRLIGVRKPDLTLVFDLEVSVGLQRARSRNQESEMEDLGRFEAENLEFHKRVREGYLQLARAEPERFAVIDATGLPEEVFRRVVAVIGERL